MFTHVIRTDHLPGVNKFGESGKIASRRTLIEAVVDADDVCY
jgi:hypothetical protein